MLVSDLLNSCYICLIQEHWLLNEQLHNLSIDSDFYLVVSVAWTVQSYCTGALFGGCAILFRKSLAGSISMLKTDSNRFCAVLLTDSHGSKLLLVNVYLPMDYGTPDAHLEYLFSLGELNWSEGFINSQSFDHLVITGDFNVDFSRGRLHLQAFMVDNDLLATDLAYQSAVQYTYVRDHSSVTSWLDHVLCYESFVSRISDIMRLDYGFDLSNHRPIGFALDFRCTVDVSTFTKPPKCQWFKVA